MRRVFFFFQLSYGGGEIPPVYATSVSEIEGYLRKRGVKVERVWKETLEDGNLYLGNLFGFEYRYGFVVDGEELVFLFTLPASLKTLSRYPVRVRRRIEDRLVRGFATRRFSSLGVVQFAELVDGKLYVATEW